MQEYIPYTYYLYHKPTGKKYYGCQYAVTNNVANPENLWSTYFTSSRFVWFNDSRWIEWKSKNE